MTCPKSGRRDRGDVPGPFGIKSLDIPARGTNTALMATVTVTPEAWAQADRLPVPIRGRIRRLILRLEHWPEVSGSKPLTGDLAGHYRMRTGDYRLQFRVEGENVIVEKVGHRDGFYGQ